MIGPSNRLAHAAALSVAEMPSQAYNPLFIYGPPGLGKTHLLHSVGNYVNAFGGGLTVRYATAEEFTNAFLQALAARNLEDFKARFRGVDVLLIDDVQFLERKARSEEELFHTFNALYDAGSQLVITCDRLPGDLGDLEDRLRERFAAGLVTDIERPDLATRIAILRKRAAHDGVKITDQALELLADARHHQRARARGSADPARRLWLPHRPRARRRTRRRCPRAARRRAQLVHPPSIDAMQEATCAHFGLTPRRAPVALTHRTCRLAPPGSDVSVQGVDDAFAAGDRAGVRRTRPHDRPPRLQTRRRPHRRLPSGLCRHRSAHRDSHRRALSAVVHILRTGCQHTPSPSPASIGANPDLHSPYYCNVKDSLCRCT